MVYFIAQNNMVKIGYSKDVKKRIKSLKTASPYPLILLGYIEGDKQKERELHNQFIDYKQSGEWFKLSDDKILNFINQNTLTNTFCDFDDKGILRVYKKMKK